MYIKTSRTRTINTEQFGSRTRTGNINSKLKVPDRTGTETII